MSFLPKPLQFKTIADFEAYIAPMTWDRGWHPAFITGHNTGVPRLSQYVNQYSDAVRQQWPGNLNHYYRNTMKWHSGPHIVICPKITGGYIWVLCDLELDGVSVSCWNSKTIGIECVGDYETEDPTTGHGAEVRDQFVEIAAALCRHFGWAPRPQILGVKGIHWHKQCTNDHHPCPGKNWSGDDVIRRIETVLKPKSTIEEVDIPSTGSTTSQTPVDNAPALRVLRKGDKGKDVGELQELLNRVGTIPMLEVDDDFGKKTESAVERFQRAQRLYADGSVGSSTRAKLAAVLKALAKEGTASPATVSNMQQEKAV